MAFRIFSEITTFFGLTGQLLAGGELRFYAAGTTTPADVYGDEALTVNNGSTVALDSSGRPDVDVWGDGEYFIELYDSLGVKQGDMDDVADPAGTVDAIPALVTGEFLTNNGALLQWDAIRQMPDPTGQDGKYPVASGSGYVLQSPPEAPVIPDPNVMVGLADFTAGISTDPTKFTVLTGEGLANASGTRQTNASVVFDTPFGVLWHVSVTQTHSGVTALATVPAQSITTSSTTGFSVLFNIHDQSLNSEWDITSNVPFTWVAFGTREVAA